MLAQEVKRAYIVVHWLIATWTQWWFTPNEVKMQEIPQPTYRIRDLGDKNFGVVYHVAHFSFFFFSLILCVYFGCAVFYAVWAFLSLWGPESSLQWGMGFSLPWLLSCGAHATQCSAFTSSGSLAPQHKPNGCGAGALLLRSMWDFMKGKSNPCQYSCLENPVDRAARQATVHGVTLREK